MNQNIKVVLVSASVAFVVSYGVASSLFRPEWKPIDNGAKIFNTQTGEIRYSSNGKSVEDTVNEKQAYIEKLEGQKKREEEEKKRFEEENKQREKESADELDTFHKMFEEYEKQENTSQKGK